MDMTTSRGQQVPRAHVKGVGELSAPSALASAVFALLVLACFAAFFVTQRLKHTPTIVQGFKMTPSFSPIAAPASGCRSPLTHREVLATTRLEYVSFRIARADQVTVTVVDSSDAPVATLVSHLAAHRYRRVSLCWNGQRGPGQSGGLAPVGPYGVVVDVLGVGRHVHSPRTFMLRRGQ